MGQAASMGSLLLAAGAPGHRYCLPNASVMIHRKLALPSTSFPFELRLLYMFFSVAGHRTIRGRIGTGNGYLYPRERDPPYSRALDGHVCGALLRRR